MYLLSATCSFDGATLKDIKKLFFLVFAAVVAYLAFQGQVISIPGISSHNHTSSNILQNAYNNRQRDVQVQGEGIVTKLLRDDLEGARHQRFILKLNDGKSLLIAHNIGLAPRINRLKIGDTVEFSGEYEWNPKGGVVHWTHHDPHGYHLNGWLKHGGKTYQ